MEVEDEFGISIPDAEAERIETAGMLYQYVRDKVDGRRRTSPCPRASAFYRVRRALVDAGVALRPDVRPATDLAEIFDAAPQAWAFFLAALGLRLPRPPLRADLARPLRAAAGLSTVITLAAWGFLLIDRARSMPAACVGLASLLALIFASAALEQRLPDDCRTVRGFIRRYEPALTPLRHEAPWDHDEAIWRRVATIVAEQAGMKPEQIRPEQSFIRDLGLN
jgi:acyl carrier protein